MGILLAALQGIQAFLQRLIGGIVTRFYEEPVLTLALAQATVSLAVGFGLGWSGEQVALVNIFLAALLGYISRQEVTPNSRVLVRQDGDDLVIAGEDEGGY